MTEEKEKNGSAEEPLKITIRRVRIHDLDSVQRAAIAQITKSQMIWKSGEENIANGRYDEIQNAYAILAEREGSIVGFTSYRYDLEYGVPWEGSEFQAVQKAFRDSNFEAMGDEPELVTWERARNMYTNMQQKTAYVMDSVVDKNYQGQKVFAQLQEELLEQTKKEGLLFLTRHANTEPRGAKSSLSESLKKRFGPRVVYSHLTGDLHVSDFMRIFIGNEQQWRSNNYHAAFRSANPFPSGPSSVPRG